MIREQWVLELKVCIECHWHSCLPVLPCWLRLWSFLALQPKRKRENPCLEEEKRARWEKRGWERNKSGVSRRERENIETTRKVRRAVRTENYSGFLCWERQHIQVTEFSLCCLWAALVTQASRLHGSAPEPFLCHMATGRLMNRKRENQKQRSSWSKFNFHPNHPESPSPCFLA